jgi:hypothetical protein
MAAKSPVEILNQEYDFLACDRDGCVGLFSTAGHGPVPDTFLEDVDGHDRAIAWILAQSAQTRATTFPAIGPGLVNTWKMAADRGLFAFDWEPSYGPYLLVAIPEVSLNVAELPEHVRSVIARVRSPDLCFIDLRGLGLHFTFVE